MTRAKYFFLIQLILSTISGAVYAQDAEQVVREISLSGELFANLLARIAAADPQATRLGPHCVQVIRQGETRKVVVGPGECPRRAVEGAKEDDERPVALLPKSSRRLELPIESVSELERRHYPECTDAPGCDHVYSDQLTTARIRIGSIWQHWVLGDRREQKLHLCNRLTPGCQPTVQITKGDDGKKSGEIKDLVGAPFRFYKALVMGTELKRHLVRFGLMNLNDMPCLALEANTNRPDEKRLVWGYVSRDPRAQTYQDGEETRWCILDKTLAESHRTFFAGVNSRNEIFMRRNNALEPEIIGRTRSVDGKNYFEVESLCSGDYESVCTSVRSQLYRGRIYSFEFEDRR